MRKGFIRGNSFPLILVDIFPPVFFFFCLSFFVYVVDRLLCFRLFGGYRGFPPYSLVIASLVVPYVAISHSLKERSLRRFAPRGDRKERG